MGRARVLPTGVERRFGDEEIIVSKTDTRGVITYANDVFLRVSGHREEDLIGRPHNIIRHPDMPRGVFRLLWQEIEAGREIFAYVLNLAADGAHYWVLAHVTATIGLGGTITGFHSNRRTPSPAAVREITQVYTAMSAQERGHPVASEAAAVGQRFLEGVLAERGVTYSEYVWSLIGVSQ